MDWFWDILLVCVIVIPITLLWLAVVVELFLRHDLSGGLKVLWLLFILVLPVIGPLTYIVVTWMHADAERDLGAAPPGAHDGSTTTSVSDLGRLDRLRHAGVITEEDFEKGKRAVLEGDGKHAGAPAGTEAAQ